MTGWSKFKAGLLHPREALLYLLLGSKNYHLMQNWRSIVEAEVKEMSVKPSNPLEAKMVRHTDIHEHLATLYMLTVELNLKTTLELGVRHGESTTALLMAAKEIGGHVFSVDIDPVHRTKREIKEYGLEDYWTFILGNDLKIDWNMPIDHLFIDTSHLFEHTIAELRKFEPYVRRGGVITMHDIVLYPDVMRAVKVYMEGRNNLKLYKYFHNNGLAVIFKR